MNQELLVALVAAVSAILGGVLTAVISPWFKHHLEIKKENKARQREQIQRWRSMILDIANKSDEGDGDISASELLQLHPDYLSLEPLLKEDTHKLVYQQNVAFVSDKSLPYILEQVKHDIAKIETDWKLN